MFLAVDEASGVRWLSYGSERTGFGANVSHRALISSATSIIGRYSGLNVGTVAVFMFVCIYPLL